MSTINTTNLKNPSSGSNNVVLNADGSATIATLSGTTITGTSVRGGITSGTAVASTSGTSVTSIDFTGIPSWVKRVTVMFDGVSTSGTSSVLVQLGAGSVISTGYASSTSVNATGTATVNSTTGFIQTYLGNDTAAATRCGTVTVTLLSSNKWTASGVVGLSNVATTTMIGGSIALSGTLDRVRITTVNGTDTFDAGSINILYEG